MRSSVSPPLGPCPVNAFRRHTLLAPVGWHRESRFARISADPAAYSRLISSMQRFRGHAYLEDGALLPSQLTADGRHCQLADYDSWHLIVQNDHGGVISCARYCALPEPRFESTTASQSALANSPQWRAKVQRVVEESIRSANERGAQFAELGGWCVAPASRNTAQALRSVLCMFALGEILGGTIGISTATKRHASSSILQRLGAHKAQVNGEVLPAYFEPMFDCEMELLQFDSRTPAARYARQISQYRAQMKTEMQVICCELAPPTCRASLTALLRAVNAASQAASVIPVPRATGSSSPLA